jgi:hypothetical protein
LSSNSTWCNINLNAAAIRWMSLHSLGVNGLSDADAKNRKVSSDDFSPVSTSKEAVTTRQASEKNQLRGDKTRFALVVSHPIQHFTPFYRALAQCDGIALKVFFCCRVGLEPYFDREMNTQIAWNMDLLSGYDHMFLPKASEISRSGPLKVRNPSVGQELAKFGACKVRPPSRVDPRIQPIDHAVRALVVPAEQSAGDADRRQRASPSASLRSKIRQARLAASLAKSV